MAFEALLDELETLQKAMADEDQKIKAAAEEEDEEPDGDEEGEDVDGDGDGKPMCKSLVFELDSGERVEAFDATELVKSLQSEITTSQAKSTEQEKVISQLGELVKSQAQAITDIRASIAKLASQGSGRRSLLTVTEDTTLAKSQSAEQAKPTPNEILAKCLDAQKAGRLTGTDVSRAEAAVNMGLDVPQSILSRLA